MVTSADTIGRSVRRDDVRTGGEGSGRRHHHHCRLHRAVLHSRADPRVQIPGGAADREAERHTGRRRRRHEKRRQGDSEPHRSAAQVLLGDRRVRVDLLERRGDRGGLHEEHLHLRGLQHAGRLFQTALLHRHFPHRKPRRVPRHCVQRHEEGGRGRVHDTPGAADDHAVSIHRDQARRDLSRGQSCTRRPCSSGGILLRGEPVGGKGNERAMQTSQRRRSVSAGELSIGCLWARFLYFA